MREKTIQRNITAYLRGVGAKAITTTLGTHGVVGTPDIIACYRGRCLVIEVKADGEATNKQRVELILWQQAGALAIVARGVEAVASLIERIDAECGTAPR